MSRPQPHRSNRARSRSARRRTAAPACPCRRGPRSSSSCARGTRAPAGRVRVSGGRDRARSSRPLCPTPAPQRRSLRDAAPTGRTSRFALPWEPLGPRATHAATPSPGRPGEGGSSRPSRQPQACARRCWSARPGWPPSSREASWAAPRSPRPNRSPARCRRAAGCLAPTGSRDGGAGDSRLRLVRSRGKSRSGCSAMDPPSVDYRARSPSPC